MKTIAGLIRAEEGHLSALKNLQMLIDMYKEEGSSMKFYPWCGKRGWALDFDDDIMELINSNISLLK